MGREELEMLKGGVVKRKIKRRVGIFIDGIGLDRATRRLDRKVDLSRLVAGLTSGIPVEVARYYTLVPYEDDARQFSFLDAVERAGLEVVTKRLPPKGVNRQVSMDVHLGADLVSFSCGRLTKAALQTETRPDGSIVALNDEPALRDVVNRHEIASAADAAKSTTEIKRLSIVVCPTREISYAIYMSHVLGAETSLADFGLYGQSDGWRGVDRWIDLSTSETIWR